ncbi:uncharacterized protein LOC106667303 isoform X2 [Cimex lectularius]|uniref:Plasmodium RESA N-terminal domain-containing protein n=1 Tax=Cimex lectularius TaxID=79782 RepID=A0A8I6THY7_CIMLE|nr:uncharacterized protein LOC106667303 isoform X2 [Cimex lectularius]
MFGHTFPRAVFITLNIFILVNEYNFTEATTYGQITNIDAQQLRQLIVRRQGEISFYHNHLFDLSPRYRKLVNKWIIYLLKKLKFDFTQMISIENETNKYLIMQLEKKYWYSDSLRKDGYSAIRMYKKILTIFDDQLKNYVHSWTDLESPYWKRITMFLLKNIKVY